MSRTNRGAERARSCGFIMIDLAFAILVFGLGAMAAAGMLIRSARLSASASELRTASLRIEEVADSLSWSGASGAGQRSYSDGAVRWRTQGGLMHLDAWGPDTTGTALLRLSTARW